MHRKNTHRKNTCIAGMAGLALFLTGAPAISQTKAPEKIDNQRPETTVAVNHGKMPDMNFVKEAASGGMAEVKLGQLAQEKGENPAVKDFGKRMVADHSKANDELKSVASQENVTLPADMSAKDKATYDRLSKLSGAAFDRAYARDMVTDHSTDVTMFRTESHDGKDAAVKSFAARTLPTLEDHLKDARSMLHDVSATSNTTHKKTNAHTGA